MKLEEMLDAELLAEMDAVGPEAKAAVEKVIGKYERYVAQDVALRLAFIAMYTKDKEAVMESVRVIGRYKGDAVRGVAWVLSSIAGETKGKEAVIKVANIMSLDEIVRTVGRYEGDAARGVARKLAFIAMYTKDKEAMMESVRVIGRYEGNAAWNIAWGLAGVDSDTKDKEAIMTACRLVKTSGSGVFDLLTGRDIASIYRDGLAGLIDGKNSFDVVAAYFKSNKELPLPTKENITGYGKLVSEYLAEAYGIDKELDNDRLLMLFSLEKSERKGLAELVNHSSERDRRAYSITVNGDSHPISIDRSRLPYLSIVAITGSRDPAKYKEAFDTVSKIVGENTIRLAGDAFKASYKSRLGEIVGFVKEGKIGDAVKVLSDTGNEAINDVLSVSNHREDLTILPGKNVLVAVESNNPLDYDSRVQIACVYLPRDSHNGIYNYCKDERFTLVRYDINGKTLGSAICYTEGDKFLVDSVEGHRTFRKPQIFDAVYKDLIYRAKSKGCEKIIFSENGANETPKEFIEYLDSAGLKKGTARMSLGTEGYLEADRDGVKGYTVSL